MNDYKFLFNDNNRNIFSNEFREKRNILISFVDNVSLRKGLDDIATFFYKIYIISGTEGTKANSGIFYPNKSIGLNNLSFIEKKYQYVL